MDSKKVWGIILIVLGTLGLLFAIFGVIGAIQAQQQMQALDGMTGGMASDMYGGGGSTYAGPIIFGIAGAISGWFGTRLLNAAKQEAQKAA